MPEPTPQQAAIIATVRDEPNQSLIVSARAGSAKSTTIEWALRATTMPVLALAFNKKIADELKPRVNSNVTVKTFNGLGHSAWMKTMGNKRLILNTDKMFQITKKILGQDPGEREEDLLMEVLTFARRAKSRGLVPRGAPMGKIGLVPDADYAWDDIGFETGIDPRAKVVDFARAVVLDSIKAAYQGEIDFDDQIFMSVLFGGVYPRYHTVVVDESQDLSPMNHQQVLKSVGTRMIAVGDPFQAIYGFRGADSNSMDNLLGHFPGAKELTLTYSFRCPHVVAARQLTHVPDFQAWASNPEGIFDQWPHRKPSQRTDEFTDAPTWSIETLPTDGFILCRNNAPLMKLAFAIIKTRRPVKILGRDIGASLATLLGKATNKTNLPVDEALPLLDEWKEKELGKAGESESKQETVHDRYESLLVLLEASGAKTVFEAQQFIKDLFADSAVGLTLASIHRSKGLEKDWVMLLDPFRLPSKFALKAARNGNPEALVQENNLAYVAETRTKAVLVHANLADCEEIEDRTDGL